MLAKVTATKLAIATPPAGAWRFSLGDLFRGTTVCALAMLAAVQFGPLAAARDMGIALAMVLLLQGWFRGSRKNGLAAVLVAALGLLPSVLAAGAPFSRREAVCLDCGMHRRTHEVCGWTTEDKIEESEASRWIAPHVPAGHSHTWSTCSLYQRTRWFRSAPIGCGGPQEGATVAWHLARVKGDAAGVEAYREYRNILTGKSTKSLAVHRKELRDAIEAAVQAKRQADSRRGSMFPSVERPEATDE